MACTICDGDLDIIDHVTGIDGRVRHFFLPMLDRRIQPEFAAVARSPPSLSTEEHHGWKKRKSAGIPHVEPALAVERDPDRFDAQASCRLPGES